MEENIQNSNNYVGKETSCMSKKENQTKHSSWGGKPQLTTGITDFKRGSIRLGLLMGKAEGISGTPKREPMEFADYNAEDGSSQSELEAPEVILNKSSSSLERDALDFESLLESGNISLMQGSSPVNKVQTDGSSSPTQKNSQNVKMYLLTHSEDSDDSTSDDDLGGDFTVSKYMESKISRLDETRFGVWAVERTKHDTGTPTGPRSGMAVDQCVGTASLGVWEVAGTSHSTLGQPSLKLTLKKSQQGTVTEELQKPKEKVMKRKYKTKRSASDTKDSHQPRKPGRPQTNSVPNLTTRQRLMNVFKKKYFRDRKRWARSNSTRSMPPTIRSIAKP